MRLLFRDKSGALAFTPDLVDAFPPYAILSHTWGEDEEEIHFTDIEDGKPEMQRKHGYQKLSFCLARAKEDGLQHVWVDTCCIDKRNLTELSEAINMMFRWYQNAARCYVFLSDIHSSDSPRNSKALRSSRWFTRGWTLQELLAPRYVDFFSSDERLLGSRHELANLISEVTGIEVEALQGKPLHSFSIERRFDWALHRQTKKPEDAIYCLLGIFGVSMTLNYAEGKEKALRRLKQEIADESLAESHGPGLQRANLLPKKDLAKRREAILDYLRFEAMDSRRSTINTALEATCGWLLNHAMYLKWRQYNCPEERDDFLWIKGHPGAGKSTLMKFIDYHIGQETESTEDLLLSFYFNARGDILERTVSGMYRSLIVQLLRAVPSLDRALDWVRFGRKEPPEPEFFRHLPISSLKELLSAVMSGLSDVHIYCLVDALDETNEEEVLDMVYYLQDVGSTVRAKGVSLITCFASRHYPTLDIPTKLQLVIDHEPGHQDDIECYIEKHLHLGHDNQATQVRKELLQKANGIFIWIVLVTGILNKEFRRGNVLAVQSRLSHLPSRMSDLLKEISYQGDGNMMDFLGCLQCILYAARPLELPEFYYAMLAAQDDDQDLDFHWDEARISRETMERAMLSYSKGLAELTQSEPPVVQFIHESVRDFLLHQGGLQHISEHEQDSSPAAGHQVLKRTCSTVLERHSDHSKPDWGTAAFTVPLLRYAASNILYHAEHAAPTFSQNDFCRTFDVQTWNGVCAELKLKFSLDKHWLPGESLMDADDPSAAQRSLFLTVITRDYEQLVHAMLATTPTLLNSASDTYGRPPLYRAINDNQVRMVGVLLAAGADVNIQCVSGFSALHYCRPAAPDIVKLILASRPDINSVDGTGRAALHVFAGMRSYKNLEALLPSKPSVNMLDYEGWSPLHHAIEFSGYDAVQLLVQAGIDINVKLADGRAPLHLAVQASSPTVVEVLAAADAQVNAVTLSGDTPLHYAAEFLNAAIISKLCDHRADVSAINGKGNTALDIVNRQLKSPVMTRDAAILQSCIACADLLSLGPLSATTDHIIERSLYGTVTNSPSTHQVERATPGDEQVNQTGAASQRTQQFAAEIKLRRQDPAFQSLPFIDMSMERAMSFDVAVEDQFPLDTTFEGYEVSRHGGK